VLATMREEPELDAPPKTVIPSAASGTRNIAERRINSLFLPWPEPESSTRLTFVHYALPAVTCGEQEPHDDRIQPLL
jgi:hypothetical protein